ncbi:NAD-P-binding protein [Mytilinidion resinicola]|uniref:NAD-P-binding protein n=1 Tax=Mytilinidion resinicola TaxID=574789 RepID=A0A6A6Y955_9PEZI|nr:NAD-P-binding protein [Mytilinidion resinicola]KAF2804357.1 NAD-P-binding protein [Mytilinidion resinicola]
MARIRIGLIGLSAAGSWASQAHLPYLKASEKYTIVALCNTSVESAKAAIKAHDLPASTKAYGAYKDLASDSDVDLVVCSVRVDRHYDAIKPALEAGKDVYCEWPLGKNLEEGLELAALAKKKAVRTMVGLQARQSALVKKIKEIVDSGRIGKVLSVSFVGAAHNLGTAEMEKYEYLNHKEVGGNLVTIHFSHGFYGLLYALGELKTYSSILEVKRPKVDLLDKQVSDPEAKVVGTTTRTSHDQILIQGHLESGALLSYHLRGGKAFAGTEGMLWRIYGETGEIQIKGPSPSVQIGNNGTKIEVQDISTRKVEEITLEQDEWDKLPGSAPNVARMYEVFADKKTSEYPDWEEAVIRHRLVDELYRGEEVRTERVAHYQSSKRKNSLWTK